MPKLGYYTAELQFERLNVPPYPWICIWSTGNMPGI